MEIDPRIIAVINTLNTIEVKGEQNLDKLLGCIQTLKAVATPKEQEEDNG